MLDHLWIAEAAFTNLYLAYPIFIACAQCRCWNRDVEVRITTVAAEMQVSRSHEASRRKGMKRIHSIIAGSLFAILIMGSPFAERLHAQDGLGVVFSVPFAFSVDGHNITAGTYKLNLVSSQYLMSIRNLKTGDLEIFSVHPEQEHAIESRGHLVFNGCGDHRYLTEFHIPGTNLYSSTMTPGRVKNAEAKACPTTDSVFLAAR
jgi:hypothetical protein